VASCLELGQVVTAGQAARLGQAFAQQSLRNSDKGVSDKRFNVGQWPLTSSGTRRKLKACGG
jgi:hypothetical protein